MTIKRRVNREKRELERSASEREMSDREKLKVYDKLREAHKSIKQIYCESLLDSADDEQASAVDAVNTVLYLVEGIFARMSD